MNLYDKLAQLVSRMDGTTAGDAGGLPSILSKLGIPLSASELARCAMQRALRVVLIRSNRPIPTTAEKPVSLTPDERTMQMLLAGAWLDGFTAGYLYAQEQREVERN